MFAHHQFEPFTIKKKKCDHKILPVKRNRQKYKNKQHTTFCILFFHKYRKIHGQGIVYIKICAHTCMYLYIYIYIYIYINLSIYTHSYIYIYIYVRICISLSLYLYVRVRPYLYLSLCIYIE